MSRSEAVVATLTGWLNHTHPTTYTTDEQIESKPMSIQAGHFPFLPSRTPQASRAGPEERWGDHPAPLCACAARKGAGCTSILPPQTHTRGKHRTPSSRYRESERRASPVYDPPNTLSISPLTKTAVLASTGTPIRPRACSLGRCGEVPSHPLPPPHTSHTAHP